MVLVASGLLPLLLVTARCQRASEAAPPANETKQELRLSLENARTALIAMIEAKPEIEREFLGLSRLKSGKSIALDTGSDGIAEGVWTCESTKRTFVFVRPMGPNGVYNCDGKFEFVEGKWQAKIAHERHAH
jgi:hypothetical protein